jgi:phosphoribosylformylglycinamidine synthase
MIEPEVSLDLALEHGLTAEEYEIIIKKMGRVPSFTELGIFSVMWSEHASYKNSIKYLKTLPKDGPDILSKAGEENAGVIDIGDGLAISFKIESHNHPSAIEPFHGAATGVGGIIRDIFTMGARPICALNSLRFGDYDDPSVQHLMKGVVEGISHYGNCFGVPTVGGEVYFENAYKGNPLVNAMAVGLLEHKNLMSAGAEGAGNFVVYVGSETGRDGIHGSTFASQEITEETEEKRTAVQVGDPFIEKLLLEATLEAIESGNVVAVQDMGAAGLTCSSSEMSAKADMGIDMDISLIPQRESGMTAYEIMLSESQERMLMIVKPDKFDAVKTIFDKWDLHAVKVGVVTDDKVLRIRHNGEIKAEIPPKLLVLGGDAPVYDREYKKPEYLNRTRNYDQNTIPKPTDFNQVLKDLISTPNIASKKEIFTQYDHMVQVNTMIEPGGDAAIVRIKNTNKGIATATDCNGRHCYLDAYEGTKGAVAESARNVICTGARPVAITNCLNFGNPYKPEVYYNFVESIKGMKDACEKFKTPVTGGNVSFYNETPTSAIYPTPTIGMVGIIDDINKRITFDFKDENDIIYLLGENCNEIGGSEYQSIIINEPLGMPPIVDLDKELLLQTTMLELANEMLLKSAHDCSDGGLTIAITESCLTNNLGCEVNFMMQYREDFELFGEAHSRIIVSVKPENANKLEDICKKNKQNYIMLGKVNKQKIVINNLIDCNINELKELYYGKIKIL